MLLLKLGCLLKTEPAPNHLNLEAVAHRWLESEPTTLAMMDQVHGRPEGTARRTFNANKERLVEGRHYFQVGSDEIRRNNPGAIPDALRRDDVVLLTERGYLVLVKSFTDDLAWQVQEQLVDGYFLKKVVEVLGEHAGNFSGIYLDSRNREQDCVMTTSWQRCPKCWGRNMPQNFGTCSP